MQIPKENLERVEEKEINMEVFSVKTKTRIKKKFKKRKKKILYKRLKSIMDMQMDTDSEVTLRPKIFWECVGKPTL